jgi:hypothetical protein
MRDMVGLWSGCAAKSAVAVREPWLRSYFPGGSPVAALVRPLYPKYLGESGGHWDPCPSLLDGAGPYAWGAREVSQRLTSPFSPYLCVGPEKVTETLDINLHPTMQPECIQVLLIGCWNTLHPQKVL